MSDWYASQRPFGETAARLSILAVAIRPELPLTIQVHGTDVWRPSASKGHQ